jgi:hypothetical protein
MRRWVALALLGGCLAAPLAAQDAKPAKEDPVHDDTLLTHLDPDVVVTWQNGEVSRKPEGVRAYYDKMMTGPDRIVASVAIGPEVDELTHLYGTTGVAVGSSQDHFKLTDGRDFVMPTRWSATVVKKDGRWLVAEFHASTNTFDNPVLHIAMRQAALWAGVAAGVVGLVLGFVIARLLGRRSPAGGGGASPARA